MLLCFFPGVLEPLFLDDDGRLLVLLLLPFFPLPPPLPRDAREDAEPALDLDLDVKLPLRLRGRGVGVRLLPVLWLFALVQECLLADLF